MKWLENFSAGNKDLAEIDKKKVLPDLNFSFENNEAGVGGEID